MRRVDDIFLGGYPSIDLHGVDRDSARVMTNDFIYENYLLGNSVVTIIHGKGSYVVKGSVHSALSKNNYVREYKLDNFNDGVTIVWLKLDKN